MAKHTSGKLNWLEERLPEGLLVDAAWLSKHGYSTSLRSQYVSARWLEQPVRGVYLRRLRGPLTWQQVVISLQTILAHPLLVGGRTALELQGYAHYLAHEAKEVHLYGPKPPPNWLHKLRLGVNFVYHNDRKLFHNHPIHRGLSNLNWDVRKGQGVSTDAIHGSLVQFWGQWNWPLTLSTPERAVLELLDELPNRESFDQVDKLMEGLANLSPRRLQKLLVDCRSVKVKRLFFFFADRHQHAWLKRIDKSAVDFGEGKRMLVKGGRLDRTYRITVPEALDGVS
jgi:Transcriptional regulator, AbiEi antitoxin, Type IV TA system/Transcriptional regulator, AbiEi antitoxin N-terminal domain